jgi:lactoylglutathione lyase
VPDRPRLVPELICSDLGRSVRFYTGVLGFRVRHERPAERFAHLERDGAELMIEQPGMVRCSPDHRSGSAPPHRDRLFPSAELSHPYGRGMNLEIDVDEVAPLHDAALAAGAEIVLALEERWYALETESLGVRQFAVADPDGYVIRLSQRVGTRQL